MPEGNLASGEGRALHVAAIPGGGRWGRRWAQPVGLHALCGDERKGLSGSRAHTRAGLTLHRVEMGAAAAVAGKLVPLLV